MDTVMVLSILNGALPIGSVVGAGKDIRRARVPKDKREHTGELTNFLTDSPDSLEKGRAPIKGTRRESTVMTKEQPSRHGCGRKMFSEILMSLVLFIATSALVWAGSPGDLKPRVPPDRLKEAQSFQNPFMPSPDIVAKGKKLYEGKAWCLACHGLEGAGGTSGGWITPHGAQPPTNFADAAWQAARTDGEMFWILQHGGHGTDMAPYMPLFLTEDEVWYLVTYIRMFGET